MKILVVTQYYYPEPLRINEICEELVKRGHMVTVLTTNPNYPNGDIYDGYQNKYNTEIIKGVKVIRCKSRPRYRGNFNLALNYISFCIKAGICAFNLKEEYDVIYAYQLSPVTSVIPAIIYKKLNSIPLVLYCLDLWPESLKGSPLEEGIIYKGIKALSKIIYKQADKILVTSPSFIRYLNKSFSITSAELLYQHSKDIHRMVIPVEFEKYKNYVNFLFMGNLGKSQNIECILKAISLINDRSMFKLHIVGSGSNFENLKMLSTKLGVEDTVIFHGRKRKEELPKYYSIADVGIVSLKDEGFVGATIPGKLQEYMAAGKAIIGCINGDANIMIQDAKCGLTVQANDHVGLSKCIMDLCNNKSIIEIYSQNSKLFFEKHFKISFYIDELLNHLDRMINV